MHCPRINLIKIAVAISAMVLVNCATVRVAQAQGDAPPKPCGWEVRSTNTPGGGGELKSQGVTGKETPWFTTDIAPSTAGSAVVNIVITYYESEEDMLKAKEIKKKKAEEAKKKREEEKKRREDERKKKKGAKADNPPKPPQGADVPTFDPRTHKLDENGKVVPIPPKQESPEPKDHKHCDIPDRFECGEHYLWWLKNHHHRNEPKKADNSKTIDPEMRPMGLQGQPRMILTGAVVAGEDTQVRVVDANGAFLSGVVVALPNGEQATTDAEGKATVKAPKNTDTMLLTLVGLGVAASAWVQSSGEVPANQALPHLSPPNFIQPGQPTEIGWSGNGGQITIDGKPVNSLAQSPNACVVDIPKDLAPGTHTMALKQGDQVVDVVPINVVGLQIEPPKQMMVGQKATYLIRVLGTDRKIDLTLNNLSQMVASLVGDAADFVVTSSGGKNNVAKVEVRTHSVGQVLIAVNGSGFDSDAIECVDYMVAKQR